MYADPRFEFYRIEKAMQSSSQAKTFQISGMRVESGGVILVETIILLINRMDINYVIIVYICK